MLGYDMAFFYRNILFLNFCIVCHLQRSFGLFYFFRIKESSASALRHKKIFIALFSLKLSVFSRTGKRNTCMERWLCQTGSQLIGVFHLSFSCNERIYKCFMFRQRNFQYITKQNTLSNQLVVKHSRFIATHRQCRIFTDHVFRFRQFCTHRCNTGNQWSLDVWAWNQVDIQRECYLHVFLWRWKVFQLWEWEDWLLDW